MAYESFSSVHDTLSAASSGSAGTGVYVVQRDGETLTGIAKALWGDERMWYLIADANSLTASNDALKTGQSLIVPAKASTVYNGADTFKPYNAAEVVGSTTPEMAMPVPAQKKGCGGLGQIVMIVVAVVATIYTAGAASSLLAGQAIGSFVATMAAGSAAIAGGSVGAAAIGGALGSIASQAVGIAIGAQDSFSWKGVALSAIGSGVSAGVAGAAGNLGGVFAETGTAGQVARAALGNVATQGVSIVTGLQSGFDWRGVAASAAGAAAGATVGRYLGGNAAFNQFFGGAADLAGNTLSGMASGTVASIVRGGKIELATIATDSFGNALRQSWARRLADESTSAGRNGASVAAAGGIGDGGEENVASALQTYSKEELRNAGIDLPTGTRFFVQPDELVGTDAGASAAADGGMSVVEIRAKRPDQETPLTQLYDLDTERDFGKYLAAVAGRSAAGATLTKQDVSTSKALLFHYYGYSMGEETYNSARPGTAQQQLAGSLDDGSTAALKRALANFLDSSSGTQTERFNFYSNITNAGGRARELSIQRGDRTIALKWTNDSSNWAGDVGVSADEALRKTDYRVYATAVNAAFATAGVNSVSINGSWRPSAVDYVSIVGHLPSNVISPWSMAHVTSKAIDINRLNSTAINGGNYSSGHAGIAEPTIVSAFTNNLLATPGVRQIFQPWRMWTNTANPAAVNTGVGINNIKHKNHLHFGR